MNYVKIARGLGILFIFGFFISLFFAIRSINSYGFILELGEPSFFLSIFSILSLFIGFIYIFISGKKINKFLKTSINFILIFALINFVFILFGFIINLFSVSNSYDDFFMGMALMYYLLIISLSLLVLLFATINAVIALLRKV